jgi:hypothetical protein
VNDFTLVLAYYENPGMLKEQIGVWLELPDDVVQRLHLRIVDDGSPDAPALDVLREHPIAFEILRGRVQSFQLWRMQEDIRWNQDACRNVGVRQARTPWLLLTDMDHVVPAETWGSLMRAKLKKNAAYRFGRVNAPALDRYKSHPNSWALPRSLYWQIGGYDEALAGYYGTDGDFLVRARAHAEVLERPEVLVRYSRDVIADASTTSLIRKSDEDRAAISRIVKARCANPEWKPLHFKTACLRVL